MLDGLLRFRYIIWFFEMSVFKTAMNKHICSTSLQSCKHCLLHAWLKNRVAENGTGNSIYIYTDENQGAQDFENWFGDFKLRI